MLIIIDKNTKQVINNLGTNLLYPDGNVPNANISENEEAIRIHDNSELANKINSALLYDFVFDDEGNVVDINITRTLEQYQQEKYSDTDYLLSQIREQRNKLLTVCDWTQLPDSPLTDEQRELWRVYRQALRDLPETVDLNNPVFPTPPT